MRYERVRKLLVCNPHLLPPLKEFVRGKPVPISLGVNHLDNATLEHADEHTFLYLIKDVDAFAKTKKENSSSHTSYFYKHGRDLLRELRVSKTAVQLRRTFLKSSCRVR